MQEFMLLDQLKFIISFISLICKFSFYAFSLHNNTHEMSFTCTFNFPSRIVYHFKNII